MSDTTRGHAILVEGPSGSGKSHFLRSALLSLKSGAVAMAPGDDEWGSYIEFEDDERFAIRGFGDPMFLPTAKSWEAKAHQRLLKWLKVVLKVNMEHYEQHGEPKHKVLGLDTYTGMGELALNAIMSTLRIDSAPAAQSPDGAAFYGGYARALREIATVSRAVRGMGVHWIALAHVIKRQDQGAAMQGGSKEQIMPAFMGQFRENVPGMFDLVLHAGVTTQGKHYLLWKPEARRVTKSRFGDLGEAKQFTNEWSVLEPLINAAIERRVKQSRQQLEAAS